MVHVLASMENMAHSTCTRKHGKQGTWYMYSQAWKTRHIVHVLASMENKAHGTCTRKHGKQGTLYLQVCNNIALGLSETSLFPHG
jgi:hypothetical protein